MVKWARVTRHDKAKCIGQGIRHVGARKSGNGLKRKRKLIMDKQQRAWEWVTSNMACNLFEFVKSSERVGGLEHNTEEHLNKAKMALSELGQWDKVCAKVRRYYGMSLHKYTTI